MPELTIEKNKLGVNISSTSIEVLQINSRKEVISSGRFRRLAKCFVSGWVNESAITDALIQTLTKYVPVYRDFFKQGLSSKNKIQVCLSVPESKVYIHHFDIKRESEEVKFKESIALIVGKYIPVDIKELNWDYLVVHEDVKGNNVRIVFIGAPKTLVNGLEKVAETAGLEVISIENESLSLSRALLEEDTSNASIIMDIGSCETNLMLFYGKRIPFVSATVYFAGDNINKILAEELSISKSDAEQLKKTKDFFDEKFYHLGLMDVVTEINIMKDYFFKKTGISVEKLVITGGSSLLPGLLDFFKSNVKLEVALGDPFYNLHGVGDLDTQENWALYANAVGLALRTTLNDNGQNIDLRTKDKASKKFIKRWWM